MDSMKKDKMVTQNRLEQVYETLDLDGDGQITRSEFLKVMGGFEKDDELWDAIMMTC